MRWPFRSRWPVPLFLLLVIGALAGGWWVLFDRAPVESDDSIASVGNASETSEGALTVSDRTVAGREPDLLDGGRRPAGPNVVTHVDGVAVWELPEDEREPFLASLRSLAEAGWSEAFLALAPVASRCILIQPRTDAMIKQFFNPDDGLMYRHLRIDEETPADRAAMREERMTTLERELEQARRKRKRCDSALGDDPDKYMKWLEQALIQQPPGFIVAILDDPGMVPVDTGWIVRNAERLARFNLGFLSALRARVMAGDPEVVARAWKAFAGRQFMPEPDPVRAWAHGLVARRLPEPWSELAPTEVDYQRLVEEGLGADQLARAQSAAEELWRRCCGDARMPR